MTLRKKKKKKVHYRVGELAEMCSLHTVVEGRGWCGTGMSVGTKEEASW